MSGRVSGTPGSADQHARKYDTSPQIWHAGSAAVEAAHKGSLQLRNVEFTYPLRQDRPVLKDLSLTIPQGKVTALVGRRSAAPMCCFCKLGAAMIISAGNILGQLSSFFIMCSAFKVQHAY